MALNLFVAIYGVYLGAGMSITVVSFTTSNPIKRAAANDCPERPPCLRSRRIHPTADRMFCHERADQL